MELQVFVDAEAVEAAMVKRVVTVQSRLRLIEWRPRQPKKPEFFKPLVVECVELAAPPPKDAVVAVLYETEW
jgi:hypothetical protein